MGGTNGCKCAYDKNLSVGYETVVAINDGGRAAIKSANSFPVRPGRSTKCLSVSSLPSNCKCDGELYFLSLPKSCRVTGHLAPSTQWKVTASERSPIHANSLMESCESGNFSLFRGHVLLTGFSELALDIVEVDSVPAFGHLAVNKSAAGMDVEANLPRLRGYTHELLTSVRCGDIQICFYDVVSLEAYSGDSNMLIGNGRVHLSPENLEAFWSARVSDRFQFMKAYIGGHDSIDPSRVWREDRVREAQEVLEELRL